MIATDEAIKGKTPKLKIDEIAYNPNKIKVNANEVVYIHFIHSNQSDFDIEINTPTNNIKINPSNTIENSCNTIIKALGNVQFKSPDNSSFYVQFLRISY